MQLLRAGTVLPNLTERSKDNDGVFPFVHVYKVIDGTLLVRAHGPADMSIWGWAYRIQSKNLDATYDPYMFSVARILALIECVYQLQAK